MTSPRVFFYVQHLLGIGHLKRAAAVARALVEAGAEVEFVLGGRMVMIEGRLQREGIVVHVVADRVTDLTPLLHSLHEEQPDISRVIARADEVKRATAGDQRLLRLRSRDFH